MSVLRRCTESWTDVPVDAELTLVYGPRWARVYLLPSADALAPPFLRAIGLGGATRDGELADPVERVHRDRTHFTGAPIASVPDWMVAAYQAFDASRHVVPLRVAALATRAIARVLWRTRGGGAPAAGPDTANPSLDLDTIARTVHAVEARVRTPDCYPRALLTALLSLSAGRACMLLVGVLAPTRKMHAWCCLDGVLPYERQPEHYIYRPLWMLWVDP